MDLEIESFFRNLLSDSTYTHSDWEDRHLVNRDWRAFEELVAVLWSDMGYETELQQGKCDGGIDVIARKSNRIPFLNAPSVAVQAKNWNKKVREPKVRDLYGVQHGGHRHSNVDNFDESVLVTSSGCTSEKSGFTRGARQFAKDNGVKLIDGETLLDLLNESNLSPLSLGCKPGKKWHLRESPCCGWSNKFNQNQTYHRTVEKAFNARTQQIESAESCSTVSIDDVCKKCMELRLD